MILFLSKYPNTPEEFRDGFYQRVENIDHFFKEDKRVYLSISLLRNVKIKKNTNGLREQISCNLILHFFLILSLFKKSSFVYIQSIYNALNFIFFILTFNKYYVLDVHGVVPEELEMQGKKKYAFIFSKVEKALFERLNLCIAVTNRMTNHYKEKYPNSKVKFINYAILPSHLKPFTIDNNTIDNDVVEVIYSGNTQVWQNVDLMLKTIKANLSPKIHYTILTGEPQKFQKKLKEFDIRPEEITIASVKPEQLGDYYKKSHYGFILRDNILVNKVACPTKIIEYLNYGIIPIVLSSEIGDFEDYGYEFININQMNSGIFLLKSQKNLEVIKLILEKNNIDLSFEIKKVQNTS